MINIANSIEYPKEIIDRYNSILSKGDQKLTELSLTKVQEGIVIENSNSLAVEYMVTQEESSSFTIDFLDKGGELEIVYNIGNDYLYTKDELIAYIFNGGIKALNRSQVEELLSVAKLEADSTDLDELLQIRVDSLG